MPRTLIVFALTIVLSLSAAAADGRRITYDGRNLNRVAIDIDTIEACDGKAECTVKVLPGIEVKITSTTNRMVSFDRSNDFSASGVVSQHVENARLPANPCLESPYPITWIHYKPAFGNRDQSPSGWRPDTHKFAGMVKGGFSFLEVPGAQTKVCIEPHGHSNKDKEDPAFAVLSIRLEANLSKGDEEIAFADSMKRASQPLADRVEDAINIAQILGEDEEHVKKDLFPKLRLLVSALAGLRIALNPMASGEYPSSVDDGIRRAVHVALRAWSYVSPDLNNAGVEEKPFSRKLSADGRAVAYAPRAFNSLLRWLITDMETMRAVYGEPASHNYGQSMLVVPLAELLLAQLDRLRAVTANGFVSTTSQRSVFDWLAANQESVAALRKEAFQGGDEAPAIKPLIGQLATRWNTDASQQVLNGLLSSKAKDDLQLFMAFLETLRRTKAAGGVQFQKVTLAGGLAEYGNGGEVRCSRDVDGEFCYVDLLKNCVNRMTCSTKLPLNGHWVAATSRTGTFKAPEDLGGWVHGEQEPVVPAGSMLPANTEVCSDLSITSVLYMPANANDRWTTESGGVIGTRTPAQPQRETVYPDPGHSMSSRCVRLEAPPNEGAYIIKSVRLKIDLDTDRTSLLNTVMINASRRLKQDLQEADMVARDHESFLGAKTPGFPEYRQAIERLIGEIDRSLFKFVNVPVTLPMVRTSAADLYVRACLLLSGAEGHELEAQGFMRSLKQVIAQLSLGLGFNRTILSPAELLPEKAPTKQRPDEVVNRLKILIAANHAYETALEQRYQAAIKQYTADLQPLLRAVRKTPRIRHDHEAVPYLVDPSTKVAAVTAVQSVGVLLDLFRKYPQRYRELIGRFSENQTWLADTFGIATAEEPPTGEDSGQKVTPLIEILHFSIDEAERQLALPWSDARYEAAYQIQTLLRDEVLPNSHLLNSGQGAAPSLVQLGQLWTEPAFQVFLVEAGKSSGNAGRHIEVIVNQIEQTLGQNLKNLGLILPNRSEGLANR